MSDPHIHLPAVSDDLPGSDPADRPLVITHGGSCQDGWCCEYLFRKHFGDKADYLRAKHGDDPPLKEAMNRPRVYLADFSYPGVELMALSWACGGRLTVIDHHASAQKMLDGILWHQAENPPSAISPISILFDLNHSGAALTWQYLKNAGATAEVFQGGNPPLFVQLVEDRDTWSWRLPDSREINAALSSYPQTEQAWDRLAGELAAVGGEGYWQLVREGAALLRQQNKAVETACRNAVELVIAGHNVLCVNTTVHHSEIGGKLAEGRPFGATFYDDLKRGLRVWSFRVRDGDFDVSELAKKFGGGGHVRASGAQRPIDEPFAALA